MKIIERFEQLHAEITAWRRDFHAHPEILFDTHRTSGIIADLLRSFGCDEVTTGIGRTGVVGVCKGKEKSDRTIALRADIDALPMQEMTGLPYASVYEGAMHACGHDGHTAMLLGAAKYLTETRNFAGSVVFVFQPAEELGGGGREMCEDGLMERWGIQEVYGLHSWPGHPVDHFATRSGPFFASIDNFDITLVGKGGHAAYPHTAIDPLAMASDLIAASHRITSRETDPMQSAVVSVTAVSTPTDAYNIIPDRISLKGTVRALDETVRQRIEDRLHGLCRKVAESAGGDFEINYERIYPVTTTSKEQTVVAARVASDLTGACETAPQFSGGDDFAFMANERPAAYVMLGNGDSMAPHHPEYDFNDEAIPVGCSFWARLVEYRLAPDGASWNPADGKGQRPEMTENSPVFEINRTRSGD